MDVSALQRDFCRSRIIVFGNLQGNRSALRMILDFAKQERIGNIVTLGRFTDRDCMSDGMSPADYVCFYQGLVDWVEEAPERHWVGLFGKYDGWVDDVDFMSKYMSLDGTAEKGLCALQIGSLFFAHFDNNSCYVFRSQLEKPQTDVPSIFFFSHSYYMGVNEGRNSQYQEGRVLRIGRIEHKKKQNQVGFIILRMKSSMI